jgi:hypothetical protein
MLYIYVSELEICLVISESIFHGQGRGKELVGANEQMSCRYLAHGKSETLTATKSMPSPLNKPLWRDAVFRVPVSQGPQRETETLPLPFVESTEGLGPALTGTQLL